MQSETIHSLLADVIRAGAAPGAAVYLSAPGEQIFAAAGTASHDRPAPLEQNSRFQLGCITKLLTALVSLEFASETKLELEAPIGRYLRELEGTPVGEGVRIRHLLSHTSGYQGFNVADPRVRFFSSWPKFIATMRERRRLFTPGLVFSYEHTEYVLLGEILKRIADAPIYELYRARIFDPLGIRCGHIASDAADASRFVAEHVFDARTRTYASLRPPPHCEFWDASLSDLTMSLGDLALLASAAAGWDQQRVFSAATVAQVRAGQTMLPYAHGGRQSEQMPVAFGLGLAEYSGAIFGHNGSARGHTCALRFDPESRLVLLVALNAWRPHVRDLLVAKIVEAYRQPGTAARGETAPPDLVPVPGLYAGADGTSVEVSADEREVCCVMRGGAMNQELRILISRNDRRPTAFQSSAAHATVGFFTVPGADSVGLMLGLNAFLRIEPAEEISVSSGPSPASPKQS